MAYTQGRIEGSQSYKYILVCGKHLKAYFQSVTFVSVHISNNALTLKKNIFNGFRAYWHIKKPSELLTLSCCWLATT